ncbi:MAG: hypothetical protein C0623_03715 [Desulfuromonas sp.]|mgnify:CR=1 FL=1|nr:MAG: hypothetical protein C0623_03715 [Desulfuromonas sp.]
MSLQSKCLTVSLFMAVFLCLMSTVSIAEVRVVARVGSVPITDFELNQKLRQLIPLASSYHRGVSQEKIGELQVKAMDSLVESALMVQYAIDEDILLPEDAVGEEFKRLRSGYSTDESFNKALGELTRTELRDAIRRKLLASEAMKVAVDNKAVVTEKSVKEYYDENKHRFKRPRQFRASHIMIKVDPSASSETKKDRFEHARKLAQRAQSGEDFYNLAYYNSDDKTKYVGGDMGYFHQGGIQKELEDVILKMKVGEISDPIKTLYGYSIVKLVESNPPQQLSFDEMKGKLKKQQKKNLYEKLKADWLASLKAKYKVEKNIE